MAFNNYDPASIVLSWKGIDVQGFMDGTFITAERTEDGFSMAVGAGGDVTRVRNRDRTGSVTVNLKNEAAANDLLDAQRRADEFDGSGVGELQLKDLNGNTLLTAESSWIRKMPTHENADDASGREWVFDCAELIGQLGGSLV